MRERAVQGSIMDSQSYNMLSNDILLLINAMMCIFIKTFR